MMSFRPDSLRGATAGGQLTGQVDYRLARNAIVSEFKKGRLSRLDVCDAHPELLRAAVNVGEDTQEECPICEQAKVRLVSYVFGRGLPASGRMVTSKDELRIVEVCPRCSWNHLARTIALTGSSAGRRRTATSGQVPSGGTTGD
jgi:hypothetical protein